MAYWMTNDPFWASAAFWALLDAIVTAAMAAIAGFADFFGNARIRAIKDARTFMMALVLYTGRKGGKLSYRIVSACCPTIAAGDVI
jgi:predicted acyl esterase